MSDFCFIKTTPCDLCPSRVTIKDEPPYDRCREHRYGDFEAYDDEAGYGCKKLAAVRELDDLAFEVSSARFRHTPDEVRRQSLRGFADVFGDCAMDIGAEFDDAAFLVACEAAEVTV